MCKWLIVKKTNFIWRETYDLFSRVSSNYYIINLAFSLFLSQVRAKKGMWFLLGEEFISKSMIFTKRRWHCDGGECSVSFLLYERGASRLWLPRNRVRVCVSVRRALYITADPEAGTSAREDKRKRRGHAIAAKFTWKLKGGSIDALCIKLMYRESGEEIFSSRVTWLARVQRRRRRRLINHLAWIYILIKRKKIIPLQPSDGVFSL